MKMTSSRMSKLRHSCGIKDDSYRAISQDATCRNVLVQTENTKLSKTYPRVSKIACAPESIYNLTQNRNHQSPRKLQTFLMTTFVSWQIIF